MNEFFSGFLSFWYFILKCFSNIDFERLGFIVAALSAILTYIGLIIYFIERSNKKHRKDLHYHF